jgi:hypothetical protein
VEVRRVGVVMGVVALWVVVSALAVAAVVMVGVLLVGVAVGRNRQVLVRVGGVKVVVAAPLLLLLPR